MNEVDTLATIDLMQRRIEHLEEELDKVRVRSIKSFLSKDGQTGSPPNIPWER